MNFHTDFGKVCIIGAGASGLAAAKTFRERGIPFDCLERENDIGGLWNANTPTGVVYDSTYLVSSRKHTGFDDYPLPDDYPIYPSHALALDYLRDYAKHFGIFDLIEFNTTVERVERDGDGWAVQVAGESRPRYYRALVLANGHHNEPRMPDIPGTFSGEIMHSRDYRTMSQLTGKRVVVVGVGNSGCDIAVDATNVARSVHHSMRRGTYFAPKFLLGRATDGVQNFCEKIPMPRWLRNRLYTFTHLLLVGRNSYYGLPTPEHWLLDTHPTVNTVLPQLVAHGRIDVKPQITEFSGSTVRFSDGSEVEADLVVFATGYKISNPFIDDSGWFRADGRLRFFLNVFHPRYDDLFTIGLIQANGSIWRVANDQAKLVASYLVACAQDPERARWFRGLKSEADGDDLNETYVASERHRLEFNYYAYRRTVARLLRRFGDSATAPLRSVRPLPAAAKAKTLASEKAY
jgi:thioredoxin reductase